eukprot:GEMP01015628.1.p1 GENE.GEMP01015628.1~~GEMP01015628.1.p1  ORF type:complete len:608 (+),score=87.34 GEMP01015628.1:71-1894(+)
MTSTENVQQASAPSSPSHAAGQRLDNEVRCKQQFEVKPTTLGGMIEGSELEAVQPPKPQPTGVELSMDCRDNNYGVHDISPEVQAPTSDSAQSAGRRPAAMAGKRQVEKRNTEMGETLDHQHDGLPDDLQVHNSHAASDLPAGRPLGGKEFTKKQVLSRETQMANAINHDHNGVLTGDAPSSEPRDTYSDVGPAGCHPNGKEYTIKHLSPRETRIGNAINHAHQGPLTGDAPLASSEPRMDPAAAQDHAAGQSAFAEASENSRKVFRPRATNVGRTMRMDAVPGKQTSIAGSRPRPSTRGRAHFNERTANVLGRQNSLTITPESTARVSYAPGTFEAAVASERVQQAGAVTQEYGAGGKRCSIKRRRESNLFDSRSSQVVRRYSSGVGMDNIRSAGRTPLDKNRGMMHFTERKQTEDRDEMLQRKIREAALRKENAGSQNNKAPSAGFRSSPRTPAKKTFDAVLTKDVLVEQQHMPKSLLRAHSVDHSSSIVAGQRLKNTGGGIGMVNVEKYKPTYCISQTTGKKVASHPAGARSSTADFSTKCREIDPKTAGSDMAGIFQNDLANNAQFSNAGRADFIGKAGRQPQGIRVFKETTSSFSKLGFQSS